MSTQPEALRLAEVSPYLEGGERSQWIMDAAAELRRLHTLNAELLAELKYIADANPKDWYEEMRDQFQQWAQSRARAAIAKTGGQP